MSTYLQLCQRLRQEGGISGSDSTVVSAAGEWKRVCDWVAQAYVEIQEDQTNWEWMRATKSFATIANQAEYAYASSPILLTSFSKWRDGSFRIYSTDVGDEHQLIQMRYDYFREIYRIGNNTTTYGYPSIISVSPTKSLFLALPPDGIYTVTGEYYTAPTVLAADADIPAMPTRFHLAIVYKAMMYLGGYEVAAEIYQRGEKGYKEMYGRLMSDQLPPVQVDRGGFL